jgi:hypothetical protein
MSSESESDLEVEKTPLIEEEEMIMVTATTSLPQITTVDEIDKLFQVRFNL